MKVLRKHPADTSDTEVLPCSDCSGTGRQPFKGTTVPCETCAQSGYRGRTGLFELFVPDEELVRRKPWN